MSSNVTARKSARRQDMRIWWAGIDFGLMFTRLIWWAGRRREAISPLPDTGFPWYDIHGAIVVVFQGSGP
jgi:hypothetical protein